MVFFVLCCLQQSGIVCGGRRTESKREISPGLPSQVPRRGKVHNAGREIGCTRSATTTRLDWPRSVSHSCGQTANKDGCTWDGLIFNELDICFVLRRMGVKNVHALHDFETVSADKQVEHIGMNLEQVPRGEGVNECYKRSAIALIRRCKKVSRSWNIHSPRRTGSIDDQVRPNCPNRSPNGIVQCDWIFRGCANAILFFLLFNKSWKIAVCIRLPPLISIQQFRSNPLPVSGVSNKPRSLLKMAQLGQIFTRGTILVHCFFFVGWWTIDLFHF